MYQNEKDIMNLYNKYAVKKIVTFFPLIHHKYKLLFANQSIKSKDKMNSLNIYRTKSFNKIENFFGQYEKKPFNDLKNA